MVVQLGLEADLLESETLEPPVDDGDVVPDRLDDLGQLQDHRGNGYLRKKTASNSWQRTVSQFSGTKNVPYVFSGQYVYCESDYDLYLRSGPSESFLCLQLVLMHIRGRKG